MNEIISSIIYTVAVFFALMLPGIILKKTNMIPDGFGKGLSNLILYIAQPALVFLAYVRPYDKEIMINSIYVFIFSIIAHVIFTLVALAVFKKAPDAKARMLKFVTIFANAAFMGITLIKVVLEETYPGATMYASIYTVASFSDLVIMKIVSSPAREPTIKSLNIASITTQAAFAIPV